MVAGRRVIVATVVPRACHRRAERSLELVLRDGVVALDLAPRAYASLVNGELRKREILPTARI